MKLTNIFVFLLIGLTAFAQLETPRPSPMGSVYQKVGLTDVTVEYSRPGVKDRVIFGDLVPYGEVWRAGANARTVISFSSDAVIGGKEVKAGDYSIFAIPGEKEWTIILNSETKASPGAYSEDNDVTRFMVKPSATKEKVERMTFTFANVTDNTADLQLDWDMTRVTLPIKTEVDAVVMKQIDDAMKGIKWRTYYDAAMYYLDNGKDLDKALTWVDKALEQNETYWMVHGKAKILAAKGEYKEAIKTAEYSKELAEKAQSSGYVKLNDDAIAKWKKMK